MGRHTVGSERVRVRQHPLEVVGGDVATALLHGAEPKQERHLERSDLSIVLCRPQDLD